MSLNKTPQIKPLDWDKLSISGENLGIVLSSILKEGIPVSFFAKGISMTPFIQDGDKLIIKPTSQITPSIGRVVAFINLLDEKLLIHRIIARKSGRFLIKSDYSSQNNDGWIEEDQILGCVCRVIRADREITFGLGVERYVIAILSRIGLLTKAAYYFNKLLIRKKSSDADLD